VSGWLIDKSALVRLHSAIDAEEWANRIERGLVRISTVTRLEVGCSARAGSQHRVLLNEPPIA
jgi:predicted nucleic acid-binding protein